MLPDFAFSVALIGSILALVVAYTVRVALRGQFRSARVDAAGTSSFLGRFPMLMTYWALTPAGRALVALGVTANAVTAASLVLGFGAGAALATGHFGLGAALSAFSALGDALDGFVARESGTASAAGGTFDAAVDRYNEFFFLGGLALVYRNDSRLLALVLLALAGSYMVSYASAKAEALRVAAPRGSMRRAERAAYLTVACGLSPVCSAILESYTHAPVVLALFLVAVVANVSSVLRLKRIAELVRLRDVAAQTERAVPSVSVTEARSAAVRVERSALHSAVSP